jgi:hypothetical protein
LFDHLVGSHEERRWNWKAERLCGPQVYQQFEFLLQKDGYFGRICAFENLVDIASSASVGVRG